MLVQRSGCHLDIVVGHDFGLESGVLALLFYGLSQLVQLLAFCLFFGFLLLLLADLLGLTGFLAVLLLHFLHPVLQIFAQLFGSLLTVEQSQELFSVEGLDDQQAFGHCLELFHVFFQDRGCRVVGFLDDGLDFFVDLVGCLFGVVLPGGEILAQEYFIRRAVVDRTQLLAESVLGDHFSGHIRRSLDIVGRAGADVIQGQLFGYTAAQQVDDHLPHLFLGSVALVLFGQGHGEAAGHASWDDGDLVDRIRLGQAVGHHRVTCFVVGGELSLFIVDDPALLLRTRDDLGDGFLDLFHADLDAVSPCCQQGRFIEHILDIRRCETGGPSGQYLQIHAGIQGLVLGMDFEDLFSSCDVGPADDDLPVESARSEQGRIQDVRTVGGCQDDDPRVLGKAVHLDQELVQGLLTFIVAAAQARATLTAYGVDLVDKDDAGGILLGLFEQVSDSGCADTDEHLDEVGTADGKEGYAGFSRCGLGNVGLTCSRRADQQDPLGDPCAQAVILSRVLEEIDDLFQFFFFFFQACYVSEGDLLLVSLLELGPAFAKGHGLAAAIALLHDEPEQEDHQADHDQCRQQTDPDGFLLGRRAGQLQGAVLDLGHDVVFVDEAHVHGAVDVCVYLVSGLQVRRQLCLLDPDALDLVALEVADHRGFLDFRHFRRGVQIKKPYETEDQCHYNDPYG